jgi:hypothetical protein
VKDMVLSGTQVGGRPRKRRVGVKCLRDTGVLWHHSIEVRIISSVETYLFLGLMAQIALWDEDIPFVNPVFYSSESMCPDSLIEHVFRPTQESTESMPLIHDRIRIMRENGSILNNVSILFILRLLAHM